MNQGLATQRPGQEIQETAGKTERFLRRHAFHAVQELGRAYPADFDASEQIGLRAGHLEDALRLQPRLGAEDLRIGTKANPGAAPVRYAAERFELALRGAALEDLPIERLAAGNYDLETLGECVD